MEKLFVSYEIAKTLKEIEYIDECLGFYYFDGSFKKWILEIKDNSDGYVTMIPAPLYQQVIDWFREKHKIYIDIQLQGNTIKQSYFPTVIIRLNPNNTMCFQREDTYYEALDKAINEAIKLINQIK